MRCQKEEHEVNIKDYAYRKVECTWDEEQWEAFNWIAVKESNWDHEAQNPTSTAYGLGQFLNSTWDSVGCTKTSDPYTQIDCMIKYIELRYKTPIAAKGYHLNAGWY